MSRGMLALVLFALIASAGIGYVAGSATRDEETPKDRAAAGRPAPARPPDSPAEIAAPDPPASVEIPDVSDLDLPPPPPDASPGTGTITARVLKTDGTPLSGALVRGNPRRERRHNQRAHRGSGPPKEDDLESRLRTYAESIRQSEAERREAVTGPDGTCVLRSIGDDVYYLQAWRVGYELRLAPGQGWEARAGDTLVFTALPISPVTLAVLLPDGSEAEKAFIDTMRGRNNRGVEWTAEDPVIELEPGRWRIRARAGEYRALNSDWVSLSVEEGEEVPALTLAVKDGPGVAGRVAFPAGEEEYTVTVVAVKADDPAAEEPQKLRGAEKRANAQKHDDRWRFVLRDLEAGSWRLVVLTQNGAVLASKTVEVADRMVFQDLEVPPAGPGEILEVEVLDPDGNPLSQVSFNVMTRSGRGMRSGSVNASRGPDGSWRLRVRPPEAPEAEAAKHVLIVYSNEYGSVEREFVPGSAGRLQVRFEEPARLVVTVAGYQGSDLEGKITLSLRPAGQQNNPYSYMGRTGSSKPDSEGKVELGPVNPGDYEIGMSLASGQGRSTHASRTPITLRSGENVATVSIPTLYSLTILADAGASGRLSVRQTEGGRYRSSWSVTVKDGRGTLENLPAGDYEVSGQLGNSMGSMRFSVPGQTSVRFEPESHNAYLVHIVNKEGDAARAGLQEGDLVVGLNGEAFTNANTMRALVTLAMEKGESRIWVLRGGRRIEIPIDAGKLWGPGGGASMQMTSR